MIFLRKRKRNSKFMNKNDQEKLWHNPQKLIIPFDRQKISKTNL